MNITERETFIKFSNPDGYYDYENFRYIYQYRDHLGNVGVSYVKDGNNLKVMDTNDYYPFEMSFLKGRQQSIYDPMAIPYNYKFLNRELQETGFYDLENRFYMSDVVIFGQHDPLSEQTLQPYAYGYNNPIYFKDPNGLSGNDWYRNSFGNVSWHDSQEDQIKGSNGETLTRLGISGSYMNVNGSVTDLNKNRTVTENGSTSFMTVPSQMSPAAMGGDVITGQGRTVVLAAFDTTKYSEPSPMLQSPALTDPSASMFKFYVEGLAGSYLLRGFGRILSYESAGAIEAAPVTNTIYKRPSNATTTTMRDYANKLGQETGCATCGVQADKYVADHIKPLVQEHYQTGTIDLNKMRSLNSIQPQCPTCSAQQGAAMSKYSKEMKKIIQHRTNGQ